MPVLSIIMPTYNRGYIVSLAIESVINQTYNDWELIIVDDGSTDDTRIVVSKYLSDKRINYFHLDENHGANYCRNYGLKHSNGKYVAFIDSDVQWKKEKINIQLTELLSGDFDIVFCKTKLIRDDGIIDFPDINRLKFSCSDGLKYGNLIDTNTAIVRRECLEAVSGFDDRLPRLQEWELFIRMIIKKGYSIHFVNEFLCDNYIQKDSISMDNEKYIDALAYIIYKHNDIFINTNLERFIMEYGKEQIFIYGAGIFGKALKNYIKKKYQDEALFVITNNTAVDNVVCISELDINTPIIIGVGKDLRDEIKDKLVSDGYINWIDGYTWDSSDE